MSEAPNKKKLIKDLKNIDKPRKKKKKPGRKKDKISREIVELRRLSRQLFEAKVNELFFITKDELIEKIEDPSASVIDLWLARSIADGIESGDIKTLQFLLDRTIGPSQKEAVNLPHIMTHDMWVEYIEDQGKDDFSEALEVETIEN